MVGPSVVRARARWSATRSRTVLRTVAVVAFVAATSALFFPRGASVARAQADRPTLGQTLYGRDCVSCHGASGEGTARGPSLRSAGTASVDFMLRTGRMPVDDPTAPLRRRSPAYSPREIAAIVEHTAAFTNGPAIPRVDPGSGDLVRGGILYRLECGICHGASGGGGALTNAVVPSPIVDDIEIAEAVLTGPGSMPSFAPDLFDQHEVSSLVRYIRHLEDAPHRGGAPLRGWGRVGEGLVVWAVMLGWLLPLAAWAGRRS